MLLFYLSAQTCSIDMAMGPLDMTAVSLVAGLLKMSQAVDMPIFQLTAWKLENKIFDENAQGLSGLL